MRVRSWVRRCVVLFAVLVAGHVDAQQLPTASAAVDKVIAAAVEAKASQLGYTSLSEVVQATEAAMSNVAAQAAASEGTTAAWLTLPAALRAAALLTVPTPLGNDSVDQWTYNADGTVTISGNPQVTGGGVTPQFPALTSGGVLWVGPGSACEGADAQAAGQSCLQMYAAEYDYVSWNVPCTQSGNSAVCSGTAVTNTGQNRAPSFTVTLSPNTYSGATCATGLYYNGACQSYVSGTPAPTVTTQTLSPAAAIADIPSTDDSIPLGPTIIAGLADALWQNASQNPGYDGIPYPVDNPITSSDASSVESGSPSSWPSIGAATSSVSSPSGAATDNNPYAIPNSTNPSGSAASSTAAASPPVTVDLGPDPGIGTPTLETIPTAAQILAPILGLLPDLRAYTVPSHTAVCPEPSFDLWGSTYTFTAQCVLLEAHASAIYAAFVLAYSIAALFIVLTA
ncbi:hypothetical protein [Paraburkholderia sp. D1E]|uniref:hypothetical protein n=1 Tax=Paraburkholderia sp. D1E TaxID=3461398 RepID=UPI00404595B7